MAIDIQAIESEILSGLRNEQQRIDEARTSLQVFHGTFTDPELAYYDREGRARRDIPIMAKVIDALTCYAYQYPPSRKVGDDEQATLELERIYKLARVNSKLKASDRHRHAGNVAALQVHATGDADDPIRLLSWTADSFVVWVEPDDPTRPQAVCTIDRYDNRTRYRLWTPDECRTYMTQKLLPMQTSGGRVPTLIGIEENPYKVLPFVFFHLFDPVTQFDEGGIGARLSQLERMLNFRFLLDADNLRYSKPFGLILGMDADDSLPIKPRPGEFKKFKPKTTSTVADDKPENVEVEWIAPALDWVEAEWSDIKYHWNLTLECVGVPSASIPLDKAVIATESGAALVARQIPLFVYARRTQELYRSYEEELAKLVFIVLDASQGGYEALLQDFTLALTWGEVVPDMPPDSPDDYLDGQKDRGELSEVMVVMKKMGLSREEAIEHLTQVAKDQAEMQQIKTKFGVQEQPQQQIPLEDITVGETAV